jgi:hypothetical protein
MQVSVETTQGLERRLTITVPAATVDAAVRKELNGLAKTRRIDGFRPGKAPVAIIKKMFGAMAHARVADEMMQNNFIKAIIENNRARLAPPPWIRKRSKKVRISNSPPLSKCIRSSKLLVWRASGREAGCHREGQTWKHDRHPAQAARHLD